jgi:hypothetical protein
MTSRTDDSEIDALPAREIHVVRGPAGTEHPVMLTIDIYGRNGRGGAAHGVLLKHDGAFLLLRDLAGELGVTLRPARPSHIWRTIHWPRRIAEIRQLRRDLQRMFAAPPSEEELLRKIFGDQIPAQSADRADRTAEPCPTSDAQADTGAQDPGPFAPSPVSTHEPAAAAPH